MKQIILYTGGGVSLSPIPAEGRTLSKYVRLIADEGRAITNGEAVTTCVDTLTPEVWTDCDMPTDEEELTAEEALAELMEVLS